MSKVKTTSSKRPIKVDLIICFSGLIFFTVLVIVIFTYQRNSQNTLELSKNLVSKVISHVKDNTAQYFKPAIEMPILTATLVEKEHLNLTNSINLETHLLQILKLNPHLSMYYVGDEKGNYLLAHRNRLGKLSTQIINREAKKPYTLWRFRNNDKTIVKELKSEKIEYDPRTRPWYIGAKTKKEQFWTKIYLFMTGDLIDNTVDPDAPIDVQYGITIAHPLLNEKGVVEGVIGADIALNSLSDFLSTLKIGKSGKAFIVTGNGKLVAFPGLQYQETIGSEDIGPFDIDKIPEDWIRAGALEYKNNPQSDFTFIYQDTNYFAKVSKVLDNFEKDWYLVIMVPEDDFVGSIKRTHLVNLILSLILMSLAIILAYFISKSFSRPIESITAEMIKIQQLDLDSGLEINSHIREIHDMSSAVKSMKQGLSAFKKYVPSELVSQLIKEGTEVKPGGEERNLTLFFSDIKDFTSVSEELSPMNLMLELSDYFETLGSIIAENKGTVDKFIGDSIMAFWGAPIKQENHAYLCCKAALECRDKLKQWNAIQKQKNKEPLLTRIGIHTGNVIVGNIGSNDRLNYTVLGENVNLASRIEGLNKIYSTEILVSHQTYKLCQNDFLFRPLDLISFKGKTEGVKLYELMGKQKECPAKLIQLASNFQKAFKFYLAQKFKKSQKILLEILEQSPDDVPTIKLLIKCKEYIENPPNENWSGITKIIIKK